jgi:hypothetical protein
MSTIYSHQVQSSSPPGGHKLPGTCHGLEWDRARKRLRSATLEAAGKAPWHPDLTPDSAAELIIRQVQKLHPGALHVIVLVAGVLVRQEVTS